MNVSGFDWDAGNRDKCQTHGVSLAEIEQLFACSPLVLPDRTGNPEARFNAVGISTRQRHIFVVFTLRMIAGQTFIRPISARYMHRKEIDIYEQSKQP